MAVDDFGLEVLKKAGLEVTPGDKSNYKIQVHIVSSAVGGGGSGIDPVRIWDGTDIVDVFDLANSNPMAVAIVDSSGDQIDSFGGGTQYPEGTVEAAIIGNAILWEDTGDTLRAVSAAKPLPVSIQNASIAVTATNLDIRDLVFASDSVDVSGSLVDVQATDLDIRNLVFATDKVDASGTVLGAGTNNIGDVDVLTLPAVTQGTSPWVVSGTVTVGNATLAVTQSTSPWVIGDGGSSISVDDNGGSITVDGSVSITGAVDTELTTADLDTGAGTDTRAVVGLVLAASGGGLLVGSANPMPVSDNSGSLTIDNATLSVVGGGTEATALRVTIATDSTGVLSVDDNGGSLTVDGTVAISGTVAVTQSTSPWVTADNQTITDNAGFTDGTSKLFVSGFIFDEVAGTALTENDAAAARIDSKRAQIHIIEDGATRGRWATVSAANALKVDGSAVTQPVSIAATVTVDSELPAAAALADNTANPTVPGVGAFLMGWDSAGSNWDRIQVGTPGVDNVSTSSFPGILTISALYAYDGTNMDRVRSSGTTGLLVQGAAADNAAAAGNPLRMGMVFNSSEQTYATADIADFQGDSHGYLKTSVRRKSQVLTAINTTYDDSPTTATSATFDADGYRRGIFFAEVTESGAATDIEFTLQMSHDDSNWYDYRHGPWVKYRFDDATIATYSTLTIAEPFEIHARYIRMKVTATGSDASNSFTVADAYFEVLD